MHVLCQSHTNTSLKCVKHSKFLKRLNNQDSPHFNEQFKKIEFRSFIRLIGVWISKFIEFHIVTSSNYAIGKVSDCLGIWF